MGIPYFFAFFWKNIMPVSLFLNIFAQNIIKKEYYGSKENKT